MSVPKITYILFIFASSFRTNLCPLYLFLSLFIFFSLHLFLSLFIFFSLYLFLSISLFHCLPIFFLFSYLFFLSLFYFPSLFCPDFFLTFFLTSFSLSFHFIFQAKQSTCGVWEFFSMLSCAAASPLGLKAIRISTEK